MPKELVIPLIAVLDIFVWVVIARVLLTWIIRDENHPMVRFIGPLVDPVLKPMQTFMVFGGVDFSPMALVVAVHVIKSLLLNVAG